MYILTGPTFEPVSVEQARLALRIDDDRFNDVLPRLISDARAAAEQETGCKFVQQVMRTELTDWPAVDEPIHVYRATAAAVSYWTGSAWQTLASNAYVFAPEPSPGRGTVLAPALGTSWPTLGAVAIGPRVRIDLTAGAAVGTDMPPGVESFIIALAGQMLDKPELSAAQALQDAPLLSRLIDPYRSLRV